MPVRKPNEDLFEESRMSFGEHLEELRKVIVRSLYGLAVCCIVGFWQADNVVQFLQKPLKVAIGDFKIARAKEDLKEQNGGYLPPELISRMTEERMIPQVVQIDPGDIIKAIRDTSEGKELKDIDLTPYRFVKQEIIPEKIGLLADRWISSPENSEDKNQKEIAYLLSLLSSEQLATLQGLVQSDLSEQEQTKQLLSILNELIEKPEIHNSEVFASALAKPSKPFWEFWKKPADDTYYLMKVKLDETDDVDLSRRMNHLLVSTQFQDQLEPPHIPMATFKLWKSAEVNPQSLTAPEVFMIWVKAGVITGLFIASPWLFYQIWLFVAAGLYKHEQRYVYIYLPFSLILFFSGAALSFFFVFEPVLKFLFQFNAGMGIEPQPRIGDWLSFVMFLPLGFGIAFQLPLVMLMLNRIGIFEISSYMNKWRIAVLVIFVVSMFLTPADPISLIFLAVPLTLLYFLGIALCRWMPRNRNPFGEEVYEP